MKELKSYIYLDQVGIDSLIAQINNEIVSEKREQIASRIQGSAEAHAGLPNMLKGVVQAEVDGGIEYETTKMIEKTSLLPHESKIPELLRFLETNKLMLNDIKQIQRKACNDGEVFLKADLRFNTDFDYINWIEAVEAAKKVGVITFYIPSAKYAAKNVSTYIEGDSYFKEAKNNIYITMDMGIRNMLQFGGFTSHLATFMRATQGKAMPLGVFGRVFKLTENFYQIKPYAVWRV